MAETPGALYFSHMRDGPLIRIRLPGGQVRAEQLRVIADLAQSAGNGRVNLTNLGNFQVRGLKDIAPDELKAALGGAGLLPVSLWADRLRNIICDPLAGFDDSELIDTSAIAQKLDEALQQTPILKSCCPKFSYLVDGGGRSNIGALPHDVGLVAQENNGEIYFRLFVAGKETRLCTGPDDAPYLAMAAARAALSFAAPGDAGYASFLKRAGSCGTGISAVMARAALALGGMWENRMRRLIPHIALAAMEERIAHFAEGRFEMRDISGAVKKPLNPATGILKQGKSGFDLCGFGVPLGRLDAEQLRAIAALADEFGRGELRLAPWHVIFIPYVTPQNSEKLLASSRELGFISDNSMLHFDISACSGHEGCRGAKLDTPEHALAVMREFAGNMAELPEPLSIHVSGCPKGCAHRGVSDILALEREDASGYYVYQNSTALAPDMKTRLPESVCARELPGKLLELATAPAMKHLS